MTPGTTPAATLAAAWTMEQARREYLRIIEPSNAANSELTQVSNKDGATLTEVAAACRGAADTANQLITDLRAGRWPQKVQAETAAFSRALGEYATGTKLCAAATDASGIEKGLRQLVDSGASQSAAALRSALSLAPAPAPRP